MADDEPSSAAGVGGGVLDLPGANQSYRDDLQARTNTLGALPRRGNEAGYRAHGGAMAGGSATRCYGVLAHGTATGRHRKRWELTARLLEVVAASWRAPKRVDDGDGDWRERKARG